MNTKLHAVTDSLGRPIRFFISAGQVSDYTGAKALVNSLPSADWLLGDRGYDQTGFAKPLVTGKLGPASQVENRATSLSNTTSAATNAETSSRSCSDA
jgi:hypothetical protein